MSKRKNHNPHKRAQRLMGNVRLWSWESDVEDGRRVLHSEAKKGIAWVNMHPRQALGAAHRINNWTLIVRAILWYPDGKVDIKPALAHFRNVDLAQLEQEAKILRKEALKGVQKGHIVDVGWLAMSYINTPRSEGDKDLFALGDITEERQMLWNHEITEELKNDPEIHQ